MAHERRTPCPSSRESLGRRGKLCVATELLHSHTGNEGGERMRRCCIGDALLNMSKSGGHVTAQLNDAREGNPCRLLRRVCFAILSVGNKYSLPDCTCRSQDAQNSLSCLNFFKLPFFCVFCAWWSFVACSSQCLLACPLRCAQQKRLLRLVRLVRLMATH